MTVKLPLYDCSVTVVLTDKVTQVANSILKKHKIKGETGEFYGLAISCENLKNYYIVLRISELSINTIVHEVSHITEFIFRERDIKMKGEPLAYMNGYLSQEVYRFAKKHTKLHE